MKVLGTVLKILTALAAIAGIVYVVATYGDKIVAWAKKMLGRVGCLCDCPCQCEDDCEDCQCEDACDECKCDCCCEAECEAVEEAPAEEAEVSSEEVSADENAVQAEENDFEG